ncbi:ABC transporter ATP-binding protein [Pantoea sp. App145]|uniref:ABC transporter ATP-binding protein n=1 Tax=Pantoea sp. App145 TaxID=3071567 RepID=UPI003A8008C7
MSAHISLKKISLFFEQHRVLDNINLDIFKGEFVVLLGPSGCGKSTILNLLAGFYQPQQGTIFCNERSVQQPDPSRGMIFQQPNLFPWLNVLDNVTFGPRLSKHNRELVNARAREWLKRVGLAGFEDHFPWQLSGGMKQRVALARAWLPGPEVLLLDEPFGALDAQTRMMMQELLRDAWLENQTTLLFVTHDVDEALFLADRVLIMSAHPGRIVDEVTLPFGRQRDIETLVEHADYRYLKQKVLQRVRYEAKRHLTSS